MFTEHAYHFRFSIDCSEDLYPFHMNLRSPGHITNRIPEQLKPRSQPPYTDPGRCSAAKTAAETERVAAWPTFQGAPKPWDNHCLEELLVSYHILS